MKQVVFVNRFFYPDHSATSQILTDLANALAAEGHDITVIACRSLYDSDSAELLAEEDLPSGVRVVRVWSTKFGRRTLFGRMVDYLSFYATAALAVYKRSRPGTVVVGMTDPPLLSVIVAPIAKCRGSVYVNWIQDVFPEVAIRLNTPFLKGAVANLALIARNWTLRRANVNVAIGDSMARHVLSQGIPQERIRVIHNWADSSSIRPLSAENNALAKHWNIGGKFVIGYSGNLGRAHDIATVIDTAESLRSHSHILFLFIGGGANKTLLEAEANRRGLSNIIFKPYQPREKLSQSLCTPDIHLITLNPQLEGLIVPSKLYGILAAGRPSIFIGDVAGEVASILRSGGCGLAVQAGDDVALSRAILRLHGDRNERETMGQNARTMLVEVYDEPIAVKHWAELLAQFPEGGGG